MLPAPFHHLKLLKTPIKVVNLTFSLCDYIFVQISLNNLIAYFAAVYLFAFKHHLIGLSATVQNFYLCFILQKHIRILFTLCTRTPCIVCWMLHPPPSPFEVTVPTERPREVPLHGKINRRRPWCGSSISSLINFRSRVMLREGVYPLTGVPMSKSKPTLTLVSIY
jgi:hypothetical protein